MKTFHLKHKTQGVFIKIETQPLRVEVLNVSEKEISHRIGKQSEAGQFSSNPDFKGIRQDEWNSALLTFVERSMMLHKDYEITANQY